MSAPSKRHQSSCIAPWLEGSRIPTVHTTITTFYAAFWHCKQLGSPQNPPKLTVIALCKRTSKCGPESPQARTYGVVRSQRHTPSDRTTHTLTCASSIRMAVRSITKQHPQHRLDGWREYKTPSPQQVHQAHCRQVTLVVCPSLQTFDHTRVRDIDGQTEPTLHVRCETINRIQHR